MGISWELLYSGEAASLPPRGRWTGVSQAGRGMAICYVLEKVRKDA